MGADPKQKDLQIIALLKGGYFTSGLGVWEKEVGGQLDLTIGGDTTPQN